MSENVLISSDESQIISTKRDIMNCLPKIQSIYDELSNIIESANLTAIRQLVDKKPQDVSYLSTIIKEMMVDKMENPSINGIPVKKEILVDYIDVPNVTALFDAITSLRNSSGYTVIIYKLINYYQLNDGVISVPVNIDSIVRAQFSYFTQNDNQASFVEKANVFLNSINELKPHIYFPGLMSKLKGVEFLEWQGDNLIPTLDTSFVQRLK